MEDASARWMWRLRSTTWFPVRDALAWEVLQRTSMWQGVDLDTASTWIQIRGCMMAATGCTLRRTSGERLKARTKSTRTDDQAQTGDELNADDSHTLVGNLSRNRQFVIR